MMVSGIFTSCYIDDSRFVRESDPANQPRDFFIFCLERIYSQRNIRPVKASHK